MKRSSTIFLQVVIVLIGIGALALMLWEPHIEGRNAHATFFQIHRRRTKRSLLSRNPHSPNKRTMQQRSERTGIDHEPGALPVNRAINVQIETIAHPNRHRF